MDDADKCEYYEFRYSSGLTFTPANDSCKMSMVSDGPKYLPQHTNEPKKQHPKVSNKLGTMETWVEFRKRK